MPAPSSNLRWKIAQAAEIRWWQRYLRKRPKADYLLWKRQYWQNMLQKAAVELQPGDAVLDAGCGPAGIFLVLQQQKVDAVDPLLEEYAQKLPHFSKSDYPYVQFHACPLEDFQPTTQYQQIFCLNAINHVAALDQCLDGLVDCLAPGGQLFLSIDAHNHPFFKRLFRWIPGDILHPHQYDQKEYEEMLTNRGLHLSSALLFDEGFFFNYYLLVAQKPLVKRYTSTTEAD
ncbi:MAG: class I SAM-dependent methyltransferase [Bacteroidota bacterium]